MNKVLSVIIGATCIVFLLALVQQAHALTISQKVNSLGFHFVGNYTILHETDKSIILSVPDPTWANSDEWLLQTQLGMITVSKVNQGNVIAGGGSVILTMTMLP